MARLLTCLFIFLVIGISKSAHARIVAIESDAGLPDKFITSICRDGRGLMWIGTRQGLCMYDGYRFLPLNGPLQNGTVISALLYDKMRDLLWAATDKGLFSIAGNSHQIRSITSDAKPDGTAVLDICLFPDGRLFAVEKSG